MFSTTTTKVRPGVPYDISRIYELLTPRPKELLQGAQSRRFIREGEIGVYNPKEKRTKRRYLFLFNDVLLITKKEGKTSYWLKVFVSLRTSLRVEDVPDSQTPNRVEFRIYAPKKTFILFGRNEEEKISWINDIKGCMNGGFNGGRAASPLDKPAGDSSQTFAGGEGARSSAAAGAGASSNYERRTNVPGAASAAEPSKVQLGGDIGRIDIVGVGNTSKPAARGGAPGAGPAIPDYDSSSDEEQGGKGTFVNIGPDFSSGNTEVLNQFAVPAEDPGFDFSKLSVNPATPSSTPVSGGPDQFNPAFNQGFINPTPFQPVMLQPAPGAPGSPNPGMGGDPFAALRQAQPVDGSAGGFGAAYTGGAPAGGFGAPFNSGFGASYGLGGVGNNFGLGGLGGMGGMGGLGGGLTGLGLGGYGGFNSGAPGSAGFGANFGSPALGGAPGSPAGGFGAPFGGAAPQPAGGFDAGAQGGFGGGVPQPAGGFDAGAQGGFGGVAPQPAGGFDAGAQGGFAPNPVGGFDAGAQGGFAFDPNAGGFGGNPGFGATNPVPFSQPDFGAAAANAGAAPTPVPEQDPFGLQ